MAKLSTVYWRGIPAQVIVRLGRRTCKRPLAERFQVAIDRAAMRAGKGSSDAYLSEWRRSAPRECGNDLEAEAQVEAERLEADYSDDRLERLVRSQGVDTESPADV